MKDKILTFKSRKEMFEGLKSIAWAASLDVACYFNDEKRADFYGVENLSFLMCVLRQTNYNNFEVTVKEAQL